jgi:CAAX protease family protein
MAFQREVTSKSPADLIRRHPLVSYFVLTCAISWLGAFAVTAPHWMRGEAVPKLSGLMMFPAMLLGAMCCRDCFDTATQGRTGLRNLFWRMHRIGPYRWLSTLAIPPGLVIAVLLALKTFISCICTEPLFDRFLV